MQTILVCAQDPVLAKKVRFLMERDECKVEILPAAGELERRLTEAPPTMLVLSRELDAEDAVELLGRLDPSLEMPPTLVLGGETRPAADFIHLVPDPVDTQAIYREASKLLQARPASPSPSTTANASPLEAIDEMEALEALEPIEPLEDDESIALSDEEALGGIARELDALEEADMDVHLADAFQAEAPTPEDAPVSPTPAPSAAEDLEPAAFARALTHAWASQQDGALVIERDDERTTVFFEQGRPVASRSSRPGDLLGKALVSRGRLTDAEYAEAAKRVVEMGVTLSEAIVELGFLGEDDIATEKGTSARELLVDCFSAREGRFWREPGAQPPAGRPFRLEVGQIITQGLRAHADEAVIDAILGDRLSGYFKLRRDPFELQRDFPLSKADMDFLAYGGRAYNVEDAADGAGLPLSEARRLMAILAVTDEVEPFQPTAREFEERIRDERETRRELESRMPGQVATPPPSPSAPPAPSSSSLDDEEPIPLMDNDGTRAEPSPPAPGLFSAAPPPPPPGPQPSSTASVPLAPPPAPPAGSSPPPTPPEPPAGGRAASDADVPPMPVPNPGEGVVPRPLAYAKPSPRGPDGSMLETPERNLSREHFQKGVGLLGKGNFSSAEEAFRDAVALCSEEHVYLIGLARAIYYNPSYRADGKLPILESIVERAQQLAPDDKRVSTLATWVEHARARA